MSLDLAAIKSKKGLITIGLALFLLTNCGFIVSTANILKDQVQVTLQTMPAFGNRNLLSAILDPHKSELLGRAQWHFFEAQMSVEFGHPHPSDVERDENYLKAHESYVKSVNEFSDALGIDSPMTCLVMTSQGEFESRCGKHYVDLNSPAEDVLRRAVIGLEKGKPDLKTLLSAKRCLAGVLSWQGRFSHANSVECQGKYSEAQQICEEVLTIAQQTHSQTDCLRAMYSLTECCFDANDYGRAQQICEQGLAIYRKTPDTDPDTDQQELQYWLLREGEAEEHTGHHVQAVKHFTEAISIAPQRYRGYQFRANAYSDSRDYAHALDDFASAISRTKQGFYCGIYTDRAKMFDKMGRYQDAIADYGQCIQPEGRSVILRTPSGPGGLIGAPLDYRLFIWRGDDYQKLHKSQHAISDYSKVIECQKEISLGEDLAAVYEKRAKSYTALGKTDLAAADKLSAKQAFHFSSELKLQ